MKNVTSLIELKESIILLEIQQTYEGKLLKQQFKTTYQNLRPVNLIKDTFKELVGAPDFKGNLVDTALSIAAGYLSKKVIIGGTHNPIKQLLGTVLQMGVTGIVAKNADGIKSTAMNLIQHFIKKNYLNEFGV
jgi:hypothetical protein